ncbi:MAG: hypothetical protein KatS3mg027_1253 [Bacteroidia bacterium]|nr:MAG: hypothetical protein KatS3mg027_1253 [Bacteroidia bacterium]
MRVRILLIVVVVVCKGLMAQENVLDSLFNQLPVNLKKFIEDPNKYRFQCIYTKIDYDADSRPLFRDYYFNYSDTVYNYPASMVKLPASVVALKKLELLNNSEVDWESPVLMDSLHCQKRVKSDSIGRPYYPHLKKWIKRMLILSDNNAYTRVYDFENCRTLHECLKDWGFTQSQIKNKFVTKCQKDSLYFTPTVYILNQSGDTIYIQYADYKCHFDSLYKNYSVGYTIRMEKRGKRIVRQRVPKSFANHNDWPLAYSHQLMKYLIFDDDLKVLNLNKLYKDSLIRYLGSYPREYSELEVDTNDYYDTWKKFFIYGAKYNRVKADTLRNINIIGRAYGFLSETAYIVDFKNNVDFLLSATIYVNPNEIMDGKYNYEEAYELFYHISRLIYEYEKQFSKTVNKFRYYENLFQKQ